MEFTRNRENQYKVPLKAKYRQTVHIYRRNYNVAPLRPHIHL